MFLLSETGIIIGFLLFQDVFTMKGMIRSCQGFGNAFCPQTLCLNDEMRVRAYLRQSMRMAARRRESCVSDSRSVWRSMCWKVMLSSISLMRLLMRRCSSSLRAS